MEAVVISKFIDARTGEVRNPGDVFDCTDERFAEINSAHEGMTFVKEFRKPVESHESDEKGETATDAPADDKKPADGDTVAEKKPTKRGRPKKSAE